jgi:hypothetical protein
MIQKYSEYNLFNSIAQLGGKVVFTVSPVRHIKDGFVENKVRRI